MRARGELEYIKLQLDYSPVEYEYLLKYNKEKEEYEINKIEEILESGERL